jgi:hypothetical protein
MVSLRSFVRALVLIAMTGTALFGVQSTALASDPVHAFSVESIDCGSVTGTFSWSDVPVGGWVEIFLYNEDVLGLIGHSIQNLGDDTNGELRLTIPFSTDQLDGWHIYGMTSNEDIPLYVTMDPELNRPCMNGSVSTGGTGQVDSEPVDARSGVTSEPEESVDVEDPDSEGRVQVP